MTLVKAWEAAARWTRGPRVVPIEDNYDNLLIGPEAVSRDVRYTRYVDDQRMLRSHSSAMVPPALRALAADPLDDIVLVCPGVVYRRDAIDWQHTGTPRQLDLWHITRTRIMTEADLEGMIVRLVGALTPGLAYRSEPRVHPYTLEGRQVDVQTGERWVEVWECGLAHPDVLATPYRRATSVTVAPSKTSNTALCRCSTSPNSTNIDTTSPGSAGANNPQRKRRPQPGGGPSEHHRCKPAPGATVAQQPEPGPRTVNHQPEPQCQV